MRKKIFLFIVAMMLSCCLKATEVYICGHTDGDYCQLISEKEKPQLEAVVFEGDGDGEEEEVIHPPLDLSFLAQ